MKKNNIMKYNSLGPKYDIDVSAYEEMLDNALSEKIYKINWKNRLRKYIIKDKNTNIAISGNYGSGKSSVINSYLTKKKKKYISVSLASFCIDNKGNKKQYNDDQIEISILQQILYTKRPFFITHSRISRIDIFPSRIVELAAIMVLSFIISFLTFIYYHNINEFFNCFSVKYPLIFLISCVIFYLIFNYNISINKISFSKIELSSKEQDESILNKYIDELINYFLYVNNNIVVFEDIDRLNNAVDIFTKLKEINKIINSSIKHKTIKFIYAIDDGLFKKQEERTKFFDIIIPILPISSKDNSKDSFKKHFNDETTNDIVNFISRYIYNERDIIDIVNEYNLYSSRVPNISLTDKEELIALMTYKNLYPNKFSNFISGEGLLYDYVKMRYDDGIVLAYSNKENGLFKHKEYANYFINEHDELSDYEKDIIARDYIKKNYPSLLLINGSSDFEGDNAFINSISGDPYDSENYIFKDINKSISKLSEKDFMFDNICSYNLFENLHNQLFIDTFFNNLSIRKVLFISNLVKRNEDDNVLKNNKKYINDILSFINNHSNSFDEEIISYYVYLTILYLNPEDLDNNTPFYSFFSGHDIVSYLNGNLNKIKNKLYKYKDINYSIFPRFDYKNNNKILEYIYNHRLYKYDVNLIEYIILSKNIPFHDYAKFFDIIEENREKIPNIYDDICNNYINSLGPCIMLLDKLNSSGRTKNKILNSKAEYSILCSYIDKEVKPFSILDGVSSKVLSYIIEKNKYEINISNILTFLETIDDGVQPFGYKLLGDNFNLFKRVGNKYKSKFIDIYLYKLQLGDEKTDSMIKKSDLLVTGDLQLISKIMDRYQNTEVDDYILRCFKLFKKRNIYNAIDEKILIALLNNSTDEGFDIIKFVKDYINKYPVSELLMDNYNKYLNGFINRQAYASSEVAKINQSVSIKEGGESFSIENIQEKEKDVYIFECKQSRGNTKDTIFADYKGVYDVINKSVVIRLIKKKKEEH